MLISIQASLLVDRGFESLPDVFYISVLFLKGRTLQDQNSSMVIAV